MTKRKRTILFAIALLLFSALIAGVFYFIGYKTAYDRLENTDPTTSQTFYAMISDIQGSTLHVAGLEVNDINFRGDFFFLWRKKPASHGGIPIFRWRIWMSVIVSPLLLPGISLPHIRQTLPRWRASNC